MIQKYNNKFKFCIVKKFSFCSESEIEIKILKSMIFQKNRRFLFFKTYQEIRNYLPQTQGGYTCLSYFSIKLNRNVTSNVSSNAFNKVTDIKNNLIGNSNTEELIKKAEQKYINNLRTLSQTQIKNIKKDVDV